MPPDVKVTVLSSLPPQKGITPYTVSLLEALASRDDVVVEALGFRTLYPPWAYPGGEQNAASTGFPGSIRVRRPLTWWNPISWLYAGATVRGDILHAQWWSWFLAPAYAATLALAKVRGKRIVVTVHNVAPHESGWWKRVLNTSVLRLADHLIVHSEHNRRALEEVGFAGERISVVPIGVQSLRRTAPAPAREAVRDRIGVPREARVVLAFGNIRPYKGIDTLLSAARLMRSGVEGLRVIIAGELWNGCPDPRDLIAALALEDVAEARIGYATDDEAADLFAAADVVAFPYHHFDGQSAAAALALSHAKPIVVTDVGGLPDLVLDPRAVVPPSDRSALADALTSVLLDEDLRTKLQADARTIAAAMSPDTVAQKTVDVYRTALSRRSSRETLLAPSQRETR